MFNLAAFLSHLLLYTYISNGNIIHSSSKAQQKQPFKWLALYSLLKKQYSVCYANFFFLLEDKNSLHKPVKI